MRISTPTTISFFRSFLRKPGPSLVILALFFGMLYASTMPMFNVGYADSDELLATAFQGGVAHPPGYPVYMFLLWVVMHLSIPGLTPTQQAHGLSIVFGVASLLLLFLTVWKLYSARIKPKGKVFVLFNKGFERWFLATLSTSLVGFSAVFWTYAQLTEKYAMSAFLTTLLMYGMCGVLLSKVRVQRQKWLLVTFLAFGLSLAHFQTVLFLLPAIGFMFLKSKRFHLRKLAVGVLGAIGVFFVSYGLALVLQSANPSISWQFTPNLEGLSDLIFRSAFSGERYATGEQVSAYLSTFDLQKSTHALLSYGLALYEHFGVLFVLVLGLGFVYIFYRRNFVSETVLLAVLFLGPALAAYLGWPEDWGTKAVTVRQFIPGFTVLGIFSLYGLSELMWRFGRLMTDLGLSLRRASMLIVFLLGVPVLYRGWHVYPLVSLRDYTQVHDRYHEMLEAFDENAVVTCYSDVSCFALLYEQSVHGLREDIDVVPLSYPLVAGSTMTKPDLQGYFYPKNPFIYFDVVTWNLDKRPVYAVELNEYYYNFFGFDYPFMYYIPHGYYGEFSRTIPEVLPTALIEDSKEWLALGAHSLDDMRKHHVSTIARDHLLNGMIYLKIGAHERAEDELRMATSIYYALDDDTQKIDSLRSSLGQIRPMDSYAPGSNIQSVVDFLALYDDYLEKKLYRKAYGAALGAVVADPISIDARLALANSYEILTDYRFAFIEYGHALRIDPQNELALSGLERMQVYYQ